MMKYGMGSLAIVCLPLALWLSIGIHRSAAKPTASAQSQASRVEPTNQSFTIDGVRRTALIYLPSAPTPKTNMPLLLVFHGHGGRVEGTAHRFNLQQLWPEAVVVYLQGLPGVVG